MACLFYNVYRYIWLWSQHALICFWWSSCFFQCLFLVKIRRQILSLQLLNNRLVLKYPYNNKYALAYDSLNGLSKPYFTNAQLCGSMTVRNKEGDSLYYFVMKFGDRKKVENEMFKKFSYSSSVPPSPFCGYSFYKNYLFILPDIYSWSHYSDARKYMTLLMCEAVGHLEKWCITCYIFLTTHFPVLSCNQNLLAIKLRP